MDAAAAAAALQLRKACPQQQAQLPGKLKSSGCRHCSLKGYAQGSMWRYVGSMIE